MSCLNFHSDNKIFPFWVMTLHCWQLWHSNITQNGRTCYWASISARQQNTPNWKPYSKKLCHIIQKEIINKLERLTNMCATSKPWSRHYTKKNYHSQNSEFTVMIEFPSRYLFFNLYTTQWSLVEIWRHAILCHSCIQKCFTHGFIKIVDNVHLV